MYGGCSHGVPLSGNTVYVDYLNCSQGLFFEVNQSGAPIVVFRLRGDVVAIRTVVPVDPGMFHNMLCAPWYASNATTIQGRCFVG